MFLLYIGKQKQEPKPVMPPCPPPPDKHIVNDDLKSIISEEVSQGTAEFCLHIVERFLNKNREYCMVAHKNNDGPEHFTIQQIYDK